MTATKPTSPLQLGQRIRATVTSDRTNAYFKFPVTGELHITEVSTDGRIIYANLYPDGGVGYGSVCWPVWQTADPTAATATDTARVEALSADVLDSATDTETAAKMERDQQQAAIARLRESLCESVAYREDKERLLNHEINRLRELVGQLRASESGLRAAAQNLLRADEKPPSAEQAMESIVAMGELREALADGGAK